jgi:hypothetical protein
MKQSHCEHNTKKVNMMYGVQWDNETEGRMWKGRDWGGKCVAALASCSAARKGYKDVLWATPIVIKKKTKVMPPTQSK